MCGGGGARGEPLILEIHDGLADLDSEKVVERLGGGGNGNGEVTRREKRLIKYYLYGRNIAHIFVSRTELSGPKWFNITAKVHPSPLYISSVASVICYCNGCCCLCLSLCLLLSVSFSYTRKLSEPLCISSVASMINMQSRKQLLKL